MVNDPNRAQIVAPGGVYAGTKAMATATGNSPDPYRSSMSPDDIRAASNNEHEDLMPVEFNQEAGVNGYLEPVSLGEHPWDIFCRTEMHSTEECKEFATALALQLDTIRLDPLWAGAPFLNMDVVGAAYHIEMALRKSLGRASLNEALQGHVGMISPEVIARGRSWGDGFRSFRERIGDKPKDWK
jgi:hypothetical protein